MGNERDNHVFEDLSSELSSEERQALHQKLKKRAFSFTDKNAEKEFEKQLWELNVTLPARLKAESSVYKFLLKIRSLVGKEPVEKIYTDDLLAKISKQINFDYPGYVDYRMLRLGENFFSKVSKLKEGADFFKPYFQKYKKNPGEFSGALCEKILPEYYITLEDVISPLHWSKLETVTVDTKNKIKIQLERTLASIDEKSKAQLYSGIKAMNWLYLFTELPLNLFCAEFTNIDGNAYTCPFSHAYQYFDEMAPVFVEHYTVKNELLSALYDFENPDGKGNKQESMSEKNDNSHFMIKAVEELVEIKTFVKGINVYKLGKVINLNYNWTIKETKDIENWFSVFTDYWKKRLEDNWSKWLISARTATLIKAMKSDFNLSSLPLVPHRPWEPVGGVNSFLYKYSGGFLFWFFERVYEKIIIVLDEIQTEGDFKNLINRNEYSNSMGQLQQLSKDIKNLGDELESTGKYGRIFYAAEDSGETLEMNGTATDAMIQIEETISEGCKTFMESLNNLCKLLQGILGNNSGAGYEGLNNLDQIKGTYNKEWKKNLLKTYNILVRCYYYIGELQNMDNI